MGTLKSSSFWNISYLTSGAGTTAAVDWKDDMVELVRDDRWEAGCVTERMFGCYDNVKE
jgi:hypothetical protein